MSKFNSSLLGQTRGVCPPAFEELELDALPPGEVLIRVAYSSLNYKDGLAVTGKPGVVRQWPMVPGVDLAGTVVDPGASGFQPGQEVVVTRCRTSETIFWGQSAVAALKREAVVYVAKG